MLQSKQFFTYFTLLLFTSLLLGCGGGGGGGGGATAAVRLNTLALSSIDNTLDIDDTVQLTATGQYSDASSQNLSSQATWSVGNTSIVSVSSTGLLTALSAGTTTVSASFDGVTSVQRSVTVRALSSLNISPSSLTLAINSSQQLSVTGIYTDNSTRVLDDQVNWTSENGALASVSSTGVVTAHAAGTVDVTASVGAISRVIAVTVSPATLQSISVSAAVSQVAAGLSAQFTATGQYSDGSQQDLTDQVVWSVSDESKATIDQSGLVTGVQAGSLSVNASKELKSGSLAFTVSPATLDSLQVSPSVLNLAKGTSQSVAVTAIFSDASSQDVSGQVTWSSTDSTKANAEAGSSLIQALDQGNVTLTASLSGQEVDVQVTVTSAELVSIALTPINSSVPLGVAQQYVAQGTYTDGSVQDVSAQVTWLSSNESVAVISNNASSKGKVDSLSVGSTMITAIQGDIQQSTELTVENADLVSIDIQPTNQTIAKGEAATVRAFGDYTDGSRINITSQVNWHTDNTDIIDLSLASNGTIQTLQQGEALLSAEIDGLTSIASVRVTNAVLNSISIEAASTSLANGTSLNLIARGHYSDASTRDITAQVTWQSDDLSVLSVANGSSDSGQITALDMGTATITVSLGAVSQQQAFTVTNAILTALQITGSAVSLNVNSQLQLSAQATYSDMSTQTVTNQVNWSSTNTGVAVVDNTNANKGLLTAMSVGTAQISVSLNGISSSPLEITVTQDANLPKALSISALPNIILNNQPDPSQVTITVTPALPEGVIADGTEVTLTITEGESQRTENLTTTNGVVNYSLSSTYQGVIILSASLDSLVANTGVLSTNDFRQAIIHQGFVANISFQNNTLGSGSAFLTILRNLSNRTFLIKEVRIRYLDPADSTNVIDLPDSPVTDLPSLSGGSLTAGEFTSIGYQLENDVEASVFAIVYFMEDEDTGEAFSIIQPFVFGT